MSSESAKVEASAVVTVGDPGLVMRRTRLARSRAFRVLVVGRDARLGEQVVGELVGGRRHRSTQPIPRASPGRSGREKRGGLDVLVNNAGAASTASMLVREATIDVTFSGMIHLTDRLLPLFSPRRTHPSCVERMATSRASRPRSRRK